MIFCKGTDFKQTPIGKIPTDWKVERIGDICEVVTGGTPSTRHPEYFGGNIKWLKSGDIKKPYIYDTEEKITQLGIENSNAKIHPSNSVAIALSGRGQTRGKTAVIKASMACSQSVAIMIPKSELVPEYLHYNLTNRYLEIRNLTGHLDRSGLNLSIVSDIRIPIPAIGEQEKINEILGVVDLAIAKTDEVIAKTERLKKGLMQELLTKGIGHKEYKQTPIGKTPKEWEIKQLSEFVTVKGRIGWRGYTVNDLRDSGPIVIGATDIVNNRIDLSDPTHISREKYEESPEIKVNKNDIVVVKTGNSIGKVAIVDMDIGEACINPNVALLKDPKNIDPYFLYYCLQGRYAQEYLINSSLASAQPAINQEKLKQLKIVAPPLLEQKGIARILSLVDRKIQFEMKEKEKLKRIKWGLMSLLLTGRIRIKVD